MAFGKKTGGRQKGSRNKPTIAREKAIAICGSISCFKDRAQRHNSASAALQEDAR
jgi:hypothetical protein